MEEVNDTRDKVKHIIKKVNDMKKQNMTDVQMEMYFIDNEEDLYTQFTHLIKKIIKGGDMEYLYKMLDMIEDVKVGRKDKESAEKEMAEELANDYLYPSFDKNKKD